MPAKMPRPRTLLVRLRTTKLCCIAYFQADSRRGKKGANKKNENNRENGRETEDETKTNTMWSQRKHGRAQDEDSVEDCEVVDVIRIERKS